MSFLTDNTTLIAFLLIIGFLVWKYVLQPIANEGQSLDPEMPDDDLGLF